ncbi:hypothetical protein KAK07_11610 [Ideonella sp. 4Y16]|uniref:Uncharacterized protein n=1 Tax=Ideonella alba TaxID=2824118 RepID=A0A941BNS9_9BURK|nr:hypothetical protein [Ideonella alba]MBQ0933664.1 hypothetical protein [Ideonella alba]MBQ0943982.1 hypothetical protein [Ideonella alba]
MLLIWCIHSASAAAPFNVTHDSMYRAVPRIGENDVRSDIGLEMRSNGFRVFDILFEVSRCDSDDGGFCMISRYLSFEMPRNACEPLKEWRRPGFHYQCTGLSKDFQLAGSAIGNVLAIVQTSDAGRQRVFYYSRARGVVAMLLGEHYYVLQSPLGIGAAGQTLDREE